MVRALRAILTLVLVVCVMTCPAATLSGSGVRVSVSDDGLAVDWPEHLASLRAPASRLSIDGADSAVDADGWSAQVTRATVDDALGAGKALAARYERPGVVRLELLVRLTAEPTQVVLMPRLTSLADRTLTVQGVAALSDARLSLGSLASGDLSPTVYVDSGSQGGTHIARLDEPRSCRGICAIFNPAAELGFVCANVSFEHDNAVWVAPGDGAISVQAETTTSLELAPGATHAFDPLLVDCHPSALKFTLPVRR
ncbi:MAG: hypothetical protein AB7Y46_05655, partial [Armatimonadota bacterium]